MQTKHWLVLWTAILGVFPKPSVATEGECPRIVATQVAPGKSATLTTSKKTVDPGYIIGQIPLQEPPSVLLIEHSTYASLTPNIHIVDAELFPSGVDALPVLLPTVDANEPKTRGTFAGYDLLKLLWVRGELTEATAARFENIETRTTFQSELMDQESRYYFLSRFYRDLLKKEHQVARKVKYPEFVAHLLKGGIGFWSYFAGTPNT